MAWVAVDMGGSEWIYDNKPERMGSYYDPQVEGERCGRIIFDNHIELPKGSILKPIGKELTWAEEPVEI